MKKSTDKSYFIIVDIAKVSLGEQTIWHGKEIVILQVNQVDNYLIMEVINREDYYEIKYKY